METFISKHSSLSKEMSGMCFEHPLNIKDFSSFFEYDVYDCIISLYYLSCDILDVSLFIKLDKLPYISVYDKDYDYLLQLEEISNYLMLDKRVHTKIEVCLLLMRNYEHFSSIKEILNNTFIPKDVIIKNDLLTLDWCLKANYHTHCDNYYYNVAIQHDNVEALKILHKSNKMPKFRKDDLHFAYIYNSKKCIEYLIEQKCPSYSVLRF